MKHMLLLRTVCLMVGVGPICAQGGLDPAVAQNLQALIDRRDDPSVVRWVSQLIASTFEFRERGRHEIETAKS